MNQLEQKESNLKEYLSSFEGLAIAFSAGVDSAFLLKEAKDVLGDRLLAITASIHAFPERELQEAKDFCKKHEIRHIIVELDELEIPGFAKNPINRCYLCKRALFSKMKEVAKSEGVEYLAEGSNMDDEGDFRPGHQAIHELGILSPLRKVDLYKAEIRQLSERLDLPTWNKPSFACLATRFVTDEPITREKLAMVEAAEQVLYDEGFLQFRVRMHGDSLARIEILPEEMEKLFGEKREYIVNQLKKIGFRYVSMDMEGYRTGSMNQNNML